jgi:hypothetical protein
MSGYGESGFDPSGGSERPLSWTQRAGVACLFIGAAIILVYIAGRLGLVPRLVGSPLPGTAFVAAATPLIAIRSGPLSPETRRQRLLIILAALALCALVAVLTFIFQGA